MFRMSRFVQSTPNILFTTSGSIQPCARFVVTMTRGTAPKRPFSWWAASLLPTWFTWTHSSHLLKTKQGHRADRDRRASNRPVDTNRKFLQSLFCDGNNIESSSADYCDEYENTYQFIFQGILRNVISTTFSVLINIRSVNDLQIIRMYNNAVEMLGSRWVPSQL